MNGYDVALFLHLLGVTMLFGGIALQQSAGARLRRATTFGEVRQWLGFVRPAGRVLPIAGVVILASGLYMTSQEWTIRTPWIAVGFLTLLGMVVTGATVLRAGYARLGRAVGGLDGDLTAPVRRLATSPGLWAALTSINGAAIGVLWLMSNKPRWPASLGVAVGSAVLGAAIGAAMARRSSRPGRRSSSVPDRRDDRAVRRYGTTSTR
jgi:hypothetical protein